MRMGRKRNGTGLVPQRSARRLYLGEWLARQEKKQTEAAAVAGVNPAYISELVSGKKDNPSPILLLDLSEWLGITVNQLYTAPPPRPEVELPPELSHLTAHELSHYLMLSAKVAKGSPLGRLMTAASKRKRR